MRQGNYGLPVCCAHQKSSTTERRVSAMVLYVPPHFPVAELFGSNPPVVELSEPPVVYILLNCIQDRFMKTGKEIAAVFAVEIRKSMCTHVLAVPIDQSTVVRTRPLNSPVQIPVIREEVSSGCRWSTGIRSTLWSSQ